MGIIEGSKGGLGLEASAIVTKIGSGVRDFHVGDRVIVFKSGCFSTKINVSSLVCVKIPDNISDEDAATMPIVYSTVVHSIINLGNLQKGQVSEKLPKIKVFYLIFQTVLIHSACGGVGLAAIQLCQSLGAEVS